jgi:chemotaxis response regulator CheB
MPRRVLITSSDILISALLGALLESEGLTPCFAMAGESSRDALLRLRPDVALIDCENVELCNDSVFGPALMIGAKIVLFGSARARDRMHELRERLGVTTIVLPVVPGQLAELIGEPE